MDLKERTAALVGCGPGAEIPLFADAHFDELTGIDISEQALAIAETEARQRGLGFTKIACNLETSLDSLPRAVTSAVFIGFVETHLGREIPLRGAARLLRKQGLAAVSDIDYAGMRASYCPELFDLLVGVTRGLAAHSSDRFQAGITAGRLGFTSIYHERHIESLHGKDVLRPFEFVLTMNEQDSDAQKLKNLYQVVASSERLREAKLELEHYEVIWQKSA